MEAETLPDELVPYIKQAVEQGGRIVAATKPVRAVIEQLEADGFSVPVVEPEKRRT